MQGNHVILGSKHGKQWETITSLNKIQKLLILFLFLVGDKHIKMHKGTAAPVQPQRLLLFAGHFNDTFMCQI